ncbi:unnamed protein product [Pleuronectes platessa]|uniref:Uncharacterized protein n=1 Tax=Pleuronectes platessa TaxID=8262 RepID=A0A9N7Y8C4_PLEPL|nr:unnamed protein product [Pleuronectes platessa]
MKTGLPRSVSAGRLALGLSVEGDSVIFLFFYVCGTAAGSRFHGPAENYQSVLGVCEWAVNDIFKQEAKFPYPSYVKLLPASPARPVLAPDDSDPTGARTHRKSSRKPPEQLTQTFALSLTAPPEHFRKVTVKGLSGDSGYLSAHPSQTSSSIIMVMTTDPNRAER